VYAARSAEGGLPLGEECGTFWKPSERLHHQGIFIKTFVVNPWPFTSVVKIGSVQPRLEWESWLVGVGSRTPARGGE
jgi:hypothetical protein